MEEAGYYYCFFDFVIKSDIPLPELVECSAAPPLFSFSLCSSSLPQEPRWLHHWYLPHGEISISFAKECGIYYLRYPHLADFSFNQEKAQITCHPISQVSLEIIRHLLLDQVLPRIVSHCGRPTVHASGVLVHKVALLFLGQSGWGKSTLGAYFYQKGHPLLSDDCLLLEKHLKQVRTIPSYQSMRLFYDSLQVISKGEDRDGRVFQHSNLPLKKRVILNAERSKQTRSVPLRCVLILNDPDAPTITGNEISIIPLQGAITAIELVKHTFHLDVTNTELIKKQFQNLAAMCGNENLFLYKLNYRRDHQLLPQVYNRILSLIDTSRGGRRE